MVLMKLFKIFQANDRLTKICSYLLLIAIILTTLFCLAGYWRGSIFFELISHFKVQYFVISIILFGLLTIIGTKRLLLVALFCVVINLSPILPWYIYQSGISHENTGNLRVLVYNLLFNNTNYSQVIAMIREENPDIAVLVEMSDRWLFPLQQINDTLPYSVTEASKAGVAIYSKLPLANQSVQYFVSQRPTIIADFKINQQVISLVATHPSIPIKKSTFKERNQILAQVTNYVQQLNNPVIITGDLNTTMWSPYYQNLIQQTGLRNSRLGFGIIPTWPTNSKYSMIPSALSWFFQIPIDHCLISPEIEVVSVDTGANVGSDHLPFITDLFIR